MVVALKNKLKLGAAFLLMFALGFLVHVPQPESFQNPLTSPLSPQEMEPTRDTSAPPGEEQCTSCHTHIETTSASHPRSMGCVACHGGVGSSSDKDQAHSTLIFDPAAGTGKRNPSSLKVVQFSCGKSQCHSGFEDSSRNHVDQVRRSMMGTLAGVISGLRYQWAGQTRLLAKYGVYGIEDENYSDTPAALKQLEPLPFFSPQSLSHFYRDSNSKPPQKISKHIGDKLLRDRCFQCHLDAPPPEGVSRSQGCAACHFQYGPQARYQGKDTMISRTEKGHPAYHRMTVLPPKNLCRQCHQGYQLSTRNTLEEKMFPAQGISRQDVHFSAGLECIDCHTQSDIMGDGNIYSKQHEAVEIRCETCHGTSDSNPFIAKITDPKDPAIRISRHYPGFKNSVGDKMAVSARKRKLSNVKLQKKKWVTLEKRTGKAHSVPLAKNKKQIHVFPGHKDKLACTACHSQWVPRCEGCHNSLDARNLKSRQGGWNPRNFSLKLEPPALMVGPRGKVVPMSSQPPRTLTVLDERGHPVPAIDQGGDSVGEYREWHFTNSDGYSGSNTATGVVPHSVGKRVRSCASCHLSPQALGLGEGRLQVGPSPSGKNDGMNPVNRTHRVRDQSIETPEAKVNPRGQPLSGTSQPGARPFNQEEITRILRVGNCIPCHNRYGDKIYRDLEASYKFERKIKHRHLRDKILKKR